MPLPSFRYLWKIYTFMEGCESLMDLTKDLADTRWLAWRVFFVVLGSFRVQCACRDIKYGLQRKSKFFFNDFYHFSPPKTCFPFSPVLGFFYNQKYAFFKHVNHCYSITEEVCNLSAFLVSGAEGPARPPQYILICQNILTWLLSSVGEERSLGVITGNRDHMKGV